MVGGARGGVIGKNQGSLETEYKCWQNKYLKLCSGPPMDSKPKQLFRILGPHVLASRTTGSFRIIVSDYLALAQISMDSG